MKTNTEMLVKRMMILYENICSLLEAQAQASKSTAQDTIEVELKNEDGTTKTVEINSFTKLQEEIQRIDNNYKSLISENAYELQADGTISKYIKTSLMNGSYLENSTFDGNNCIADKTSIIEDLMYPIVKLPIQLSEKIVNHKIHCKICEITTGFEDIEVENPKEIYLQYLKNQGIIDYEVHEKVLDVEKQRVNYYGKFTILSVRLVVNEENTYALVLSDIHYTSRTITQNTIELKTGDYLVSKTGITKYIVSDIDATKDIVYIKRVEGTETPIVGIDQLIFNETFDSEINSVVNIPIKPAKQIVVFLSTETSEIISYPSPGIKIDTTDFIVNYNGEKYTIDEFFQNYVIDFGEYLQNLVSKDSIPYILGIKPETPVLNSDNFKVVLINKHLIDSRTNQEMTQLNERKAQIQNDIDFTAQQIKEAEAYISGKKFGTITERTAKVSQLTALQNKQISLNKNLLVATRNIDKFATKLGIKTLKPKYKIIGFWDLQDPIYSPYTKPQHIIHYEVQYRYLSKDVDTVDTNTYKMISNGKEVSVAFSQWNTCETKILNKIENQNGEIEWEEPAIDNVDDININQCSITIQENESVEIRVRAMSEAGYPVSPIMSEWSEILRIDFPENLKENTLQSNVSQNEDDLTTSKFKEILESEGITSHINSQVSDGEKIYRHSASDITSGLYNDDNSVVPLDVAINNIIQAIKEIKSSKESESKSLTISLIDFEGEIYNIANKSTISLYGGNYANIYNYGDVDTYGTIIKKTAYIRIKNNTNEPLEITSCVPGINSEGDDNNRDLLNPEITEEEIYTNVPVKIENYLYNHRKQIIYSRKYDVSGVNSKLNKLIKGKIEDNKEYDYGAEEDERFKTIISKNAKEESESATGYVSINRLIYREKDGGKELIKGGWFTNQSNNELEARVSCYTLEHPGFVENGKSSSILKADMDRIQRFTALQRINNYQAGIKYDLESEITENPDYAFGFSDNDKYACGVNTCGAFLYPMINKLQSILVNGTASTSSLIIYANSEILIPIIFEYRFSDRTGRIGMEIPLDFTPSGSLDGNEYNYLYPYIKQDHEYVKRIGFDMMLNKEKFSFDIIANAIFDSSALDLYSSNDSIADKFTKNEYTKEDKILSSKLRSIDSKITKLI